MSTYAIKADKFFLPAGPQLGGYLMVEDGVFGAWQADEPSCEIKDYTGSWIAPGMVDTHIHGFYNHSTTDNDPEGIDISSTELARRGTTSWLPTTFTDGVEQIKDACAAGVAVIPFRLHNRPDASTPAQTAAHADRKSVV